MDQMILIIPHPTVDLSGLILLSKRLQEVVNRHPDSIFLLELDIIVEVSVQLAGKIAQNRLEKRVDSAHIEVAIVKQQLVQRLAGQRTHPFLTQAALTHEVGQIIALCTGLSQAMQFLDDAALHHIGSLVGKGDSQQQAVRIEQAVITLGPPRHQCPIFVAGEQQMTDILLCQLIGLARSCRGFNDQ